MITALTQVATFLLQNADLVEELANVITSGASKDSIKAAIRSVKVAVSDEAMKEELGA